MIAIVVCAYLKKIFMFFKKIKITIYVSFILIMFILLKNIKYNMFMINWFVFYIKLIKLYYFKIKKRKFITNVE